MEDGSKNMPERGWSSQDAARDSRHAWQLTVCETSNIIMAGNARFRRLRLSWSFNITARTMILAIQHARTCNP
jgi:hypothetical protein